MIARLNAKTTSALLVALLVLFASGTAFAQETGEAQQADSGHSFTSTSKVNPVMLDDRVERDLALSAIAYSEAETSQEDQAKTMRMMQTAMDASNFSGESTQTDLWAMKAGLLAGALPHTHNQPKLHKAALSWLDENMETSKQLDDSVATALRQYVEAVRSGKKPEQVAPLYSRLMTKTFLHTTFKGATGNETDYRMHGYLLGGLWASLAHRAALNGKAPGAVTSLGDALIAIFEEDAVEGGTDEQFAQQLRLVVTELEKESPDANAIAHSIGKMNTLAAGKSDKAKSAKK